MNSFRPFQPKPGLKPTVRSIARLNDDDTPPFSFEREDELTFRGDDRAAGEMLLMLAEALRQFRAQNGANITISGNTTIQQNICNILNNYRAAVSGGISVELRALLNSISASFSAGNVTAAQADDMIERVSAQLGKIRVRPERRNASTSDVGAELLRVAEQLKKNSDVKRREFFGDIPENSAPAQRIGMDSRRGVLALEFVFRTFDEQTAPGAQFSPETQGKATPGKLTETHLRELRRELNSERFERFERTERAEHIERSEHVEQTERTEPMPRQSAHNAMSADFRSVSAQSPAGNSAAGAGSGVAAKSGAVGSVESRSAGAPRSEKTHSMVRETVGKPLSEAIHRTSGLPGLSSQDSQNLSGISVQNSLPVLPKLFELAADVRRELLMLLAGVNAVPGAFPGGAGILAHGKPGSPAADPMRSPAAASGISAVSAPGLHHAAQGGSFPGAELVYVSPSEKAGAAGAFSTAVSVGAAKAANAANLLRAVSAAELLADGSRAFVNISARHEVAPGGSSHPREIPPHIPLRQSLTGGVSPAGLRTLERSLLHIPGEPGSTAENAVSIFSTLTALESRRNLFVEPGRTVQERLSYAERELLHAGAGHYGGGESAQPDPGSARAGTAHKSEAMQGGVLLRGTAGLIRGNTYRGTLPAAVESGGAETGTARYPDEVRSGQSGAHTETISGAYSGGIAELFRAIGREGASQRVTAAFTSGWRRGESAGDSFREADYPKGETMVYAGASGAPTALLQQGQPAQFVRPAQSIPNSQSAPTASAAGSSRSTPESPTSAATVRFSSKETARRTPFAGELLAALERQGFKADYADGKGALTEQGASYAISGLPSVETRRKRRRREKRAAAQYGVKLEYSGGQVYFRGIPAGVQNTFAAQSSHEPNNRPGQALKSSLPRAGAPAVPLAKQPGRTSENERIAPAERPGMSESREFIRIHNTYSVPAVFPGGLIPAGAVGGAEPRRLALPAARPLIQRVLSCLIPGSAETAAYGFPACQGEYPGRTGSDTRVIDRVNSVHISGEGIAPAETTLHKKRAEGMTQPRPRVSVKLLYANARLTDIVTRANALIEPRGGNSTADSPAGVPEEVVLRPAGQNDGVRLNAIYDRRSTALFYSETGRAAESAIPVPGSSYSESVNVYALGGGTSAAEADGLVFAALPGRRGGEPAPEKSPSAEQIQMAQPGETPQEPSAIPPAPMDEKRLTELIRSTVDDVTTRREYVELLRKSVLSPESTERLFGLVMERLENRLRTESRISGR